jgi:hypothetical protein
MLKYPDPARAALEAYQYYQACIDKYKRTNHSKDYAEVVRARKDFQRKSQYARNHKPPDNPSPDANTSSRSVGHPEDIRTANKALTIEYLQHELAKQRDKNARLRKALKTANEQLSLPVDDRDPIVLRNLITLESNP